MINFKFSTQKPAESLFFHTMAILCRRMRGLRLEYADVPTVFYYLTLMLRILTLNIDSRYKRRIPLAFYAMAVVTVAACVYVYIVSVVWTALKCSITGDKVTAMVTISLAICNAIGNTKLFFLFIYSKELREIFDGYLLCHKNAMSNPTMHSVQRKCIRKVTIRAVIVWCWIMFNWVVYVIKPLVLSGRRTIEATVLYGLEPITETPNYEIGFVLTLIASLGVCYVSATVCALLIILGGCTEAQMLGLSNEVLNLWHNAVEEMKSDRGIENGYKALNDIVKKKLVNIVSMHAMNITQLHLVERVFRNALAIEVLLVLSALVTELLGGIENTFPILAYAFILIAFDSIAGQKLLDASVAFETAVYFCRWENYDVTNMKTVLLILKGSQKNLILTVGGITPLNYITFMTVVRFTYSAFTAFKSMYY